MKSTRASEESSRSTSERVVISSEKIATFLPWSTAALRAMFSASAVFPMLGPRRDDHELAGLEAAGHLVEVAEAGRHAGELRRRGS